MTQSDEMIRNLLQELQQIVRTQTVVGEAMQAGNSTVIPVSKVMFGFGGGGGNVPGKKQETGGASGVGGGASIEPVAFIVITNGKAQLLSLKEKGGLTPGKVIDLIPEILEHVRDFAGKRSKKKVEKEKSEEE